MSQIKITKTVVTSRASENTETYLNTIGKIEMITPEEEIELTRKIKTGDKFATDKLVKANLKFVVSVAKEYQNRGILLDDLINDGNEGLVRAAQKFDETKGFKFISYAVWWIREAIMKSLAEHMRIVRLPRNKITDLKSMEDAINAFMQVHEREPSSEELLNLLEISKKTFLLLEENRHGRSASFDAPLFEEGEGNLYDFVPGERIPEVYALTHDENMRLELYKALKDLSPEEKNVVCMYHGVNRFCALRFEHIADSLGCTVSLVRKTYNHAIKKLRVMHGEILHEFLYRN